MTSMGRVSLFVLSGIALATSFASGCSSPDATARMPDTTPVSGSTSGGSSNAGTSSSNAGNGSTTAGSGGGSMGGSGAAGGPPSCMILPVQNAILTEFTPPDAVPVGAGGAGGEGGGAADPVEPISKISFGYDANPPTVASGFSFFYPEATLTSDMSEGAWHVSGSVAEYAAFQIAFVCGADAAQYQGISFKISGSAGPSGGLTFVVAHAADAWRDPNGVEPTPAKCVSANQYDGTCTEAQAVVEVTETETTVSLMWADIKGGKPQANPNPAEIMALRWLFKWDEAANADAAAHQYDVDVTLDDVKFIE